MNAPMFHRPRLVVLLNGAALDANLAAALLHVELHQCLGAPAVLSLSFADAAPHALAAVRPGIALSVAADGGETLFTGMISEIAEEIDAGHSAVFRVTARDALHECAPDLIERFAAGGLGKLSIETVLRG